jgi:hypothetical protein
MVADSVLAHIEREKNVMSIYWTILDFTSQLDWPIKIIVIMLLQLFTTSSGHSGQKSNSDKQRGRLGARINCNDSEKTIQIIIFLRTAMNEKIFAKRKVISEGALGIFEWPRVGAC